MSGLLREYDGVVELVQKSCKLRSRPYSWLQIYLMSDDPLAVGHIRCSAWKRPAGAVPAFGMIAESRAESSEVPRALVKYVA